jgi:hypothetical protein
MIDFHLVTYTCKGIYITRHAIAPIAFVRFRVEKFGSLPS